MFNFKSSKLLDRLQHIEHKEHIEIFLNTWLVMKAGKTGWEAITFTHLKLEIWTKDRPSLVQSKNK